MQENEISVMEALNQIQSLLNLGKYEQVIQGCHEILEIEPGNQRALALLKQAETKRHEANIPQSPAVESVPFPVEPTSAPAEPTPEPAETAQPEMPSYDFYESPMPSKKKMFLAMVVPAILVVAIGGFAINFINNQNRAEIIEDVENPTENDKTPIETAYLDQNEQRVKDLNAMHKAIQAYFEENQKYPTIAEVEVVLKDELGTVPKDPKHKEKDASGDEYGYLYAFYNVLGSDAGAYVLSAIFEDSKGEAHAWAKGANIKNYPDFRDTSLENVIFIGE